MNIFQLLLTEGGTDDAPCLAESKVCEHKCLKGKGKLGSRELQTEKKLS